MLASFDAHFKYLGFPPSYEALTTTQPQVALGCELVSMCSCMCACVSMLIGRKRERETRKRDGLMNVMDREAGKCVGGSVKNKGKYEQQCIATRGRNEGETAGAWSVCQRAHGRASSCRCTCKKIKSARSVHPTHLHKFLHCEHFTIYIYILRSFLYAKLRQVFEAGSFTHSDLGKRGTLKDGSVRVGEYRIHIDYHHH